MIVRSVMLMQSFIPPAIVSAALQSVVEITASIHVYAHTYTRGDRYTRREREKGRPIVFMYEPATIARRTAPSSSAKSPHTLDR